MSNKQPATSAREVAATRTVTTDTLRTALARPVARLEAPEEQLLRMRHGAGLAREEALEQVGQLHAESREKLLSIELELLRQWKARQAAVPAKVVTSPVATAPVAASAVNPRRDKIVNALRMKKRRS